MTLSLSHWYPGSGVVLDCIDSWPLPSFLPSSKLWQDLPQSINELYYSANITFYIRKQAGNSCHFIRTRIFSNQFSLYHVNANCVNSVYCWVSRVSIKLSVSVIREALHLLKQTGKPFLSIQSCQSVKLYFFSNCDHSVKTNVPYYSIKK